MGSEKNPEEQEKAASGDRSRNKPGGSLAGAGSVLVQLLKHVKHSLQQKCEQGRRVGKPKRCWFVESVEEVAQPLRLEAGEVAKCKETARTVDFVSTYPSFDQKLLKKRLL